MDRRHDQAHAGDYEAEWTFTPAEGYEEYATATGTVTIKVKPAKLTGFREGITRITPARQHRIDNRVWAKCRQHSRDVHLQRQGRRQLYFGRTDFTDAGIHRLLQSGSREPRTSYRYVHRDHRPLPISLLQNR